MKVSTTIECEEDVKTMTTLAEQNPEIQKSLATICDVVGDEVTLEKAKLLLKGAGYNVEVAINHLLDDLEKHGRTSPTPKAGFDDKVNKILSDLAEEVKCAVCLGYLNDPVVLNCLHTFCSSCLTSAVHKRKLICPLCRVETKLDSSGVGGLKRNHYLANIVEKLKTAQTNRICSECQSSICSVFCKQCKVFLCNACNERVHSIRLLHSHTRIPFEQCFALSSNVKTSKAKKIANITVDDTDFVIPFNVKVDVCYDLFHQWARSLWFVPSDFASKSVIEQFSAMYLPYYLFDVEVATQYSGTCAWSALNHLSKTYAGTTGQSSKTMKKITKTLNDVLVCGSPEVIDDELLKAIAPWKVDQIQRFTLKHSDGVEVKGFKDTVDKAWKEAKVQVSERMKIECENQAKKANPLDKLIQLNVHTKVLKRRVKRIFVPVYVAEVEYRGKTYTFVVNGATTKVSGQRPYSTTKLASLSVTGLSAAIGLISIVRK